MLMALYYCIIEITKSLTIKKNVTIRVTSNILEHKTKGSRIICVQQVTTNKWKGMITHVAMTEYNTLPKRILNATSIISIDNIK